MDRLYLDVKFYSYMSYASFNCGNTFYHTHACSRLRKHKRIRARIRANARTHARIIQTCTHAELSVRADSHVRNCISLYN